MSMDLSDRSEFLGVNLKPEVKDALREEAKREGRGMSRIVSNWIEERLAALGFTFARKPAENERPLPFSEETK